MRIERTDKDTVQLGPLDLLCCEFIHQIPSAADPDKSAAVRTRLFPTPTNGEHPKIDKDWRNYVEPDLAELFSSSLEIIERDIAGFPSHDSHEMSHTLEIPMKHLDAWVHGLNQARIALAVHYNFTEADMNGEIPIDGHARSLALFQEHFYGLLIECFVRILNHSEAE